MITIKNNEKNICVTGLLSFISIVYLFLLPESNPDVWWMLATGQDIVNEGFKTVDFLSMHQNLNYIAQQWLSCVLFYGLNSINYKVLYIFTYLLFAVESMLIFKLLLKKCSYKKSLFITCLSAFFLTFDISIRPHMLSIILFTLELYILESHTAGSKKIYLLPVLSLILINLHGAIWPVFFVLILPYFAEYILKNNKLASRKNIKKLLFSFQADNYQLKPLVISTFLSIITGFINPYGYKAVCYGLIGGSNSYIRRYVNEMKTIFAVPDFSIRSIIYPLLLCIIVFAMYSLKDNRLKYRHFFLFGGTFLMTCISGKCIIYYALAVACVLSNVNYSFKPLVKIFNTLSIKKFAQITSLMCACVLIIMSGAQLTRTNTEIIGKDMIEYIAAQNDTATVACLNEGGYAEYLGLKPYADTRMELYTKKINKQYDYFNEYIDYLIGNKTDYENFVYKYNFDYVLLNEDACDEYIQFMDNSCKYKLEKNTECYRLYKITTDF